MREILFRGKRIDNDEWVEGSLLYDIENNLAYIAEHFEDKSAYLREVSPETVGQYTGLKDKKGKKIFEGDILDVKYNVDYVGVAAERMGLFVVIFDKGCYMKKKIGGSGLYHFILSDEYAVVGNINDNPELIEGDTI